MTLESKPVVAVPGLSAFAQEESAIACIFVLYNPKSESLKKLVDLSARGYQVVAVINAINDEGLRLIEGHATIQCIKNQKNVGLALALNQGLFCAFQELKTSFAVLFDQDSEFDLELPLKLVQELMALGDTTACVGPKLLDVKAKGAQYVLHNSGHVQTIPTSGTAISKKTYNDVGPMKEDLFIDGIDHEWCFRASSKGFKIAVSDQLVMSHDMGDASINWFGQYKPLYKNPIRHFYIIRNSIYLAQLSYIPIRYRLEEVLKIVRRIFMYVWASNDRLKTIQLIAKAIRDGFFGRLGELID
jgi:rhamnosyltransferase